MYSRIWNNRVKMRLIVFTGAGMSAESGIQTFRGSGGLWENHRVEDVASPEAWQKKPELVTRFYNKRREQLRQVAPNDAHLFLAELEGRLDMQIITQNIDDLHERAGSKKVLHLHGELLKARCVIHEEEIVDLGEKQLDIGSKASCGNQLRPHVVWFGEAVPAYESALHLVRDAQALIVIGSSLKVYPAAGLVFELAKHCPLAYVDPGSNPMKGIREVFHIQKSATKGLVDIEDWLSSIGAL